jgi:hypothetical protein
MLALSKYPDPGQLTDRLYDAPAVTTELVSEIVGETCRRFPSVERSEKTDRIERLMQSGAWTDATLALIDLELPQWQLRRITYDEGEWHCALSQQRELPDWLDQSIETRHADLALAILSAFVEARRVSAPSGRPSVPGTPRRVDTFYEPICSDNFA